jgi:hypothetical protein
VKPIWCPYLGDVTSDTTLDHTIALALGGHDRMSLPADRAAHEAFTEVDSYWSNHYFFAGARRTFGIKGHSRAVPYRTRATVAGFNGTIDWQPDTPIFHSGRRQTPYGLTHKRPLRPGEEVNIHLEIDTNKYIQLASKIGLGVGYQLFADTFENFGQHQILRQLLKSENADMVLRAKNGLRSLGNFWLTPFTKVDEFETTIPVWFPLLLARPGGINIIAHYTQSEVVLAFSMFGVLRSYMNIAVDSGKFKCPDGDDLGIYLEVAYPGRKFRQMPLRARLKELLSAEPPYAADLLKRLGKQ